MLERRILDVIDPALLGRHLRASRTASGLSERAVARELGSSVKALTAIENGQRRAKPHELIKLASIYGRPVSEFVTLDCEKQNLDPQDRTHQRTSHLEALVLAYERGDLSEGQLARKLGMDRVSVRLLVWRLTKM